MNPTQLNLSNMYAPELPLYKQATLEKEAILPALIAGGGLAFKALMAYWAAKGAWDIGTKDLPGLAKNVYNRNWGGAVRNLGSAAVNGMLAIPGAGAAGKGLSAAAKGGKMLAGGGRMAGKINTGAQLLMQSRMGAKLLPMANRGANMMAKGPQWLMNPQGWKDTAKTIGAMGGASIGSDMAANAMGAPGPAPAGPRHYAYPIMQQPGMLASMSNYVRNMPATGAARYQL